MDDCTEHGALIASALRAGRTSAALTQEQLAERSGLSVRGIRNLEAGKVASPRCATLQLLVDALGEHGERLRRAFAVANQTSEGLAHGGAPNGPLPALLPRAVAGFTGRDEALAMLDEQLLPATGTPAPTAVISALSGTAGVGKTALAVHWAHAARDAFPDGQLYVDLRGYDPDQPLTSSQALAGFLLALGVPPHQVPLQMDAQVARFRSLTDGRAMLVVLDNAAGAEQVRPLLPGSPTVRVIVTSRDALPGLVAREGARRIDLDVLSLDEALQLLRLLVGARVDREPDSAAELVRRCACLPLAIRVLAELAVSRPSASLRTLAQELDSTRGTLGALAAGGDVRTAVSEVFSWSCHQLAPDIARTFRLLGFHPGGDFDAYAAAALVGSIPEAAQPALQALTRAHLIEPTTDGRYAMHDLMREYARGQAEREETPSDRWAAIRRHDDYILATVTSALKPRAAVYGIELASATASTPCPAFDSPERATAWLEIHRKLIVSTCARAFRVGRYTYVLRLATATPWFLERAGYYADEKAVQTLAAKAARRSGDDRGHAQSLKFLSNVDLAQGNFRAAAEHISSALELYVKAGDRAQVARSLDSLGACSFAQGDFAGAAGFSEQSAAAFAECDEPVPRARALTNHAACLVQLGELDEAARLCREALQVFQASASHVDHGVALEGLGLVEAARGGHREALALFDQALTLYREHGYRYGEVGAQTLIADSHRELCQIKTALEWCELAVAGAQDLGHRPAEIAALFSLGQSLEAADCRDRARSHYTQALTLALETGDRHAQTQAQEGLARCGSPGRAALPPPEKQPRRRQAAPVSANGSPDGAAEPRHARRDQRSRSRS